jgi:hypothetical protein
MKITHDGEKIWFNSENDYRLAYTDYEEKLWEKIQSTSWHVKRNKKKDDKEKTYINSSKLGLLHRVVMAHWYGEEELKKATAMKYVVDHMDNDGFNCSLENLCFIPKDRNTAKGLTYDKKRAEVTDVIALNIFKDFKTQLFQITIGFNIPTAYKVNDQLVVVSDLKLLYENDFDRTFFDAERILHDFTKYNVFDTNKLNHIKLEYTPAIPAFVSPEEADAPFIIRDGKVLLNLDSEQARLDKVAPNKELYKNNHKE